MHIHSPLGGIGVLSLSTRRTRSLDWFPYACLAIMELHTEAHNGSSTRVWLNWWQGTGTAKGAVYVPLLHHGRVSRLSGLSPTLW
jgi:hypothetical protein